METGKSRLYLPEDRGGGEEGGVGGLEEGGIGKENCH